MLSFSQLKNTVHCPESVRIVKHRNIQWIYLVTSLCLLYSRYFLWLQGWAGMTCFQIVPILPPLRLLFTVKKGVKPGMITQKNKDTGVWNMSSPCLDTIRGELNHSQGTGPDSGIRRLLSHWSMAGWLKGGECGKPWWVVELRKQGGSAAD